MDDHDLARPALQERSRRTRDRLLAVGRELFSQRDLNGIGVAEITRLGKCSVGTFYDRFENKDLFFKAVLRDLIREADETLAAQIADAEIDALPGLVVSFHVALVRERSGLFSGAAQLSTGDPEVWDPMRELAVTTMAGVVKRYERERGGKLGPEARLRAYFACELLFSNLLAMVVGRMGPVTLADERLEGQLKHALTVLFRAIE